MDMWKIQSGAVMGNIGFNGSELNPNVEIHRWRSFSIPLPSLFKLWGKV
jgi:hypothetical protein